MNISKFSIVWKFLTGGREAVLDYALDVANNFTASLDDAKQSELKGYLSTASSILATLESLRWLCPKAYLLAYAKTIVAFTALVNALSDLNVTKEELATVCDLFRVAYAAWRAE